MQTFLPYSDYAKSAQVLDMMRLGKQRVETFQVLQRLVGERLITSEVTYHEKRVSLSPPGTPEDEIEWELREIVRKFPLPREEWTREKITTTGWTNHPVVKMWRGHELELLKYQEAVCLEWVKRGYKDTCLEKSEVLLAPHKDSLSASIPPWLGNEEFHASHRANLVRKAPEYYSDFFPEADPEAPYIWPI